MQQVDLIHDKTVQAHYRTYYKNKIWDYTSGKKSEKKNQKNPVHVHISIQSPKDPLQKYESRLFNLILHCPALLEEADIMEEFICFEPKQEHLTALQREMFVEAETWKQTPTALEFKKALKSKNMQSSMDILANQAFLDAHEEVNVAKSYWRYVMSCYEFTRMEEEYKHAVSMETDTVSERVFALKKQKDLQEKQMLKYQQSLDMVLEE